MPNILGFESGALTITLVIFAIVVAIMGGAVLWLYRDTFRQARAMLAFLAMLMFIPVGAKLVLQKTKLQTSADTQPLIIAIDTKKIDSTKAVVYLTLSEPGYAFAQLAENSTGKTTTVVPLGGEEKRIGHTFEINLTVSGGGKLKFVVNGEMVERVEEIR